MVLLGVLSQNAFASISSVDSDSNKLILYKVPIQSNDGIRTSSICKSNLDTNFIFRLVNNIRERKLGEITSLLIYKDNSLLLEEYFLDKNQEQKSHLFSVAKSYLSILIGKAIELGYIKSENEPIINYLPELKRLGLKNGIENLKIVDLLTMTSTIDGEKIIYMDSIAIGNHMEKIFVNQTSLLPGNNFKYSDLDAHILGHVLFNATLMPINDFADKYLFTPMQIIDYNWYNGQCGLTEGGYGLELTSRDFLKLGILAINKGLWNGNRIVNEDWINKSVNNKVHIDNTNGYGYLWRTTFFYHNNKMVEGFYASGSEGQYLMVLPSLHVVIALTGKIPRYYKRIYRQLFEDYIIPAIAK
jgi:CubicO group peptidase (beta-lactamase class C family)